MMMFGMVGLIIVAAFALTRLAPWAGIDLAPLIAFAALFVIVMGAGLILIDVRNGYASTGLPLGAAFVAFGAIRLRQQLSARHG